MFSLSQSRMLFDLVFNCLELQVKVNELFDLALNMQFEKNQIPVSFKISFQIFFQS